MSQQSQSELLVQLHIAEYAALMDRLTNWITLQCSLWAVLVIYLALIAQIWHSFPEKSLLVWFTVLIFEVVAVYWCYWQKETYRNVYYVEKQLRPLLEKHVGKQVFWRYEKYMASTRGPFVWWEWNAVCFALIALGCAVWWRHWVWTGWDYLGCVTTCLVFVGVLSGAITMVKTRLEMLA